jgi:sec-independent protein translocase protein TatB
VLGINGWEALILVVLAVVILGPERLPEYAAKLAQGVRKLRVLAEGAKVSLKDQLGPDYQDINWRQYDPRQYDPRRIVREALAEPLDYVAQPFKEVADQVRSVRDEVKGVGGVARSAFDAPASAEPSGSGAPTEQLSAPEAALVGGSVDGTAARHGSYWDSDAT